LGAVREWVVHRGERRRPDAGWFGPDLVVGRGDPGRFVFRRTRRSVHVDVGAEGARLSGWIFLATRRRRRLRRWGFIRSSTGRTRVRRRGVGGVDGPTVEVDLFDWRSACRRTGLIERSAVLRSNVQVGRDGTARIFSIRSLGRIADGFAGTRCSSVRKERVGFVGRPGSKKGNILHSIGIACCDQLDVRGALACVL